MSVQIDLSVENGRVEETFDTTSRSTNFTILSRVFANTVYTYRISEYLLAWNFGNFEKNDTLNHRRQSISSINTRFNSLHHPPISVATIEINNYSPRRQSSLL